MQIDNYKQKRRANHPPLFAILLRFYFVYHSARIVSIHFIEAGSNLFRIAIQSAVYGETLEEQDEIESKKHSTTKYF